MQRLGIEVPPMTDEERLRVEEEVGLDGIRESLRLELARLSGDQRDALELRIVQELPYAEVARKLEISEQAARARVSRGLKTLAASLDLRKTKESIT